MINSYFGWIRGFGLLHFTSLVLDLWPINYGWFCNVDVIIIWSTTLWPKKLSESYNLSDLRSRLRSRLRSSFWISRQLPRLEKNSKCSNLYIRLLRHNKRSIVSENTFSCEYMSKFPKCSTSKNWLSSTSFIYGSVDIFSTYHKSLWYTEYHTLCKKHFRSWNFALHETKIFVWLNMLKSFDQE